MVLLTTNLKYHLFWDEGNNKISSSFVDRITNLNALKYTQTLAHMNIQTNTPYLFMSTSKKKPPDQKIDKVIINILLLMDMSIITKTIMLLSHLLLVWILKLTFEWGSNSEISVDMKRY
jgi:hypothetical protein